MEASDDCLVYGLGGWYSDISGIEVEFSLQASEMDLAESKSSITILQEKYLSVPRKLYNLVQVAQLSFERSEYNEQEKITTEFPLRVMQSTFYKNI